MSKPIAHRNARLIRRTHAGKWVEDATTHVGCDELHATDRLRKSGYAHAGFTAVKDAPYLGTLGLVHATSAKHPSFDRAFIIINKGIVMYAYTYKDAQHKKDG